MKQLIHSETAHSPRAASTGRDTAAALRRVIAGLSRDVGGYGIPRKTAPCGPGLDPGAQRADRTAGDLALPLTLLLCLTTLLAMLFLYVTRGYDDNRLTSWYWVFSDASFARTFIIVAAVLPLAYPLSLLKVGRSHYESLLFAAAFLAVVPLWLVPESIIDSARYVTYAKQMGLMGSVAFVTEWGRSIPVWTDLPLVPFLYGTVFGLAGESRTAIQILTTGTFAATAVLTYRTGRLLWGERTGLYGAGLLLAMPYLLSQAPLMLVDVPTMFFLTLAFYTTLAASRHGGAPRLFGAGLAVALALLCKYSAWVLLSVLPLALLVTAASGDRKRILWNGLLIGLWALALTVPFLWIKSDLIAQQLGLLYGYQLPGLQRWQESAFSTYLFQIHPFVTAAAAASVIVALWRRDPKYLAVFGMVALLMLLDIKRARYAMVTFPMLALMAGYGLAHLRQTRIARLILFTAVLPSLVITWVAYRPSLLVNSGVNLQEAGAYLDTLDEPVVEVYLLPQAHSAVNPSVAVPILDLFTDKQLIYRPAAGGDVERTAPDRTSPVRFTWDYRLPGFYLEDHAPTQGGRAVAVILSRRGQVIPGELARCLEGFVLAREMALNDGKYRYQTLVRIYRRA